MTDKTIDTETHEDPTDIVTAPRMLVLALAALLFSFGLTMWVFAAAYAKDVQTLAKAPELVWAFICGRPSEYGTTLPLLLTIGTMTILGGTGVLIWRAWRGRTKATAHT